MSDLNAAHWDNYWQGRASKQSGNALVEVGIENNHALKTFWIDKFSQSKTSDKIIDFACGAGSVLEHAYGLGLSELTGVDVSQEALNVMKEKIPPAIGICAQVDNIPQADKSYDLVVSQYGVEYAGSRQNLLRSFQEMRRILKPTGRLTVIAHAKNGVIYEGCKTSLDNAKRIEESDFINLTAKILAILHAGDQEQDRASLQKQVTKLNEAAEPIMTWLKTSDTKQDDFARFTYHILQSSHKLITNHNAYSREDSLNWLSNIESEIDAYKGRMTSITKAALTEEEISELIQKLSLDEGSLTFDPTEEFYFGSKRKRAAWVIRARKH